MYQFTLHYLLNGLIEKKALKPGSITDKIIEITSDKLLDEIFGDLGSEKVIDDANKKHTKESKAKKAMLVYEIYA